MNLRTKITLWFVLLHLLFAVAAAFVITQNRLLLLAVAAAVCGADWRARPRGLHRRGGGGVEADGSLNQFMSGFADVVRIRAPNLRETNMLALLESAAALLKREMDNRAIALKMDSPDGAVAIDTSSSRW